MTTQTQISYDETAVVLAELVRVRSCNGADVKDGEADVLDRVEAMLESTGCEIERIPLPSGGSRRESLGARLPGARSGPSLLLNGHVDTVPVDDVDRWSVGPWDAVIRDGRLYGRGSADMKAGIAAQILAAQRLAKLPPSERVPVVLHFAADEEMGGPGTTSLLDAGFTADIGICTEPTSLDVAVVMRGMTTYELQITGKAAHVGYPENGLNPLLPATTVLSALFAHDRFLHANRRHPRTGSAGCIPTIVRSGVEQCSIPDSVELTIDRRMIPGEVQAGAVQELDEVVRVAMSAFPDYGWNSHALNQLPPAEAPPTAAFVGLIAQVAQAVSGRAPTLGATAYASDVTHMIWHGRIPSVTFGPGDCSLAHAADEHVSVAEVAAAAGAYVAIATSLTEAHRP